MTAAIFGLVGVIIGSVLSALLNFLVQRSQELRRWRREDERRFEQERLSLYRDFLNHMDRVHTLGKVDNEKVSAMLAEMWLLSSRAVYIQASMAFGASTAMVEELREKTGNSGDFDPSELRAIEDFDVMDDIRRDMTHRFNEEVRKELGVPTDWEQVPEGREGELTSDRALEDNEQAGPWWRRMLGG